MNRILLYTSTLLILLSFIKAGASETCQTDTLLKKSEETALIVTQCANGVNVSIIEKGGEEKTDLVLKREEHIKNVPESEQGYKSSFRKKPHNLYVFPSSSHHSYWSIGIDGFTFGFNSACGQPEPGGLQWSKSIDIGWLDLLNIRYNFHSSSLSFGIGFDWRNYRISTSDRYLSSDPEGILTWMQFNKDVGSRGSRLKIFSLQLPLLYEYAVAGSFVTLKGGPIFNFNTHASVKTEVVNLDATTTTYFNDISSQRLFSVDLFADISFYRMIGIYFRYSPFKILKNKNGVNFYPLTLGVSIGI